MTELHTMRFLMGLVVMGVGLVVVMFWLAITTFGWWVVLAVLLGVAASYAAGALFIAAYDRWTR